MVVRTEQRELSRGGGGTRSPSTCSNTHTPRFTGLVRLGNDVADSVAAMPRMPPRLGLASWTRRILGPGTSCFNSYNLANDSFRKV